MTMPRYSTWEKIKKENTERLYKMQKELCNLSNSPCFIFGDGICPFCKRNIFDYLTEEKAKKEIITKCPNPQCCKSFCD